MSREGLVHDDAEAALAIGAGAAARRRAGLGARPHHRPRAAAGVDPLLLGRGRPRRHARRARARPGRHQCPRRLLPADRRVRGDDVPGHRPSPAPAARAPARADLAAAARHGAGRHDGRDRRLREHRRRDRQPAGAVRGDGAGHPSPSGAGSRRRAERRAAGPRPARRAAAPQRHRGGGGAADRRHGRADRRGPAPGDARARLADQHRPRPAARRAGAAAGARIGLDRRRGARRLQRGAAAARLAAVRHPEPDHHPAHLVVERPGGGPLARAVRGQPAALRRQASRSRTSSTWRPGTSRCRSPSSGCRGAARRPSSTP